MVIPISVKNVHGTQIQAVGFEFTPKEAQEEIFSSSPPEVVCLCLDMRPGAVLPSWAPEESGFIGHKLPVA